MSAPERIWAASVTENYGEWQTTTDGLPRPTEYVRADLVMARCSSCDGTGDVHRADGEWLGECNCGGEFRHTYDVEANPSKAFRVIQSLSADRDFWKERFQVETRARIEAEALSRTGAVKVKPLEWEERVGVEGTFDAYTSIGHYIATITDDDRGMWFVVGLTQSNYCAPDIDIVKAAAQADYERRVLSALEHHQRATSTVDAHETANVSDKPEGQQEPVARGVVWFGYDENTGEFTGEYCSVKPHDARGMRPYIPYTTRPADQAVTEEMVERALVAWFDAEVTWDKCMTPPLRARMVESMRAAINAAIKALEARDG